MERKRHIRIALAATALISLLPMLGFAQAKKLANPGTAMRAIQDLDAMLNDFRTGKLSEEDKAFNAKLKKKIIGGTFDIRELTKLAMASHWNEINDAQRDHLVNLMVALIEERALLSKEQSAAKSKGGGKYRVMYKSEKYSNPEKTRAFVRTVVVIPSENIDLGLNYRLKKADNTWKVYDIIVDEASLIDNYRYQFHSIIAKNGYQELVNRIEKKLNEIKSERK
ncbi:MAG: ABC transporter substrate-binding protein [Deltaproteobacteria bacterium]|nr:ABC transporter substrate-binding protein [Deltaproteobacteria bacterium]